MSWLPTATPLHYLQIKLPREILAKTGRPSLRVASPDVVERSQDNYFTLVV
jgi:hypothetical protein